MNFFILMVICFICQTQSVTTRNFKSPTTTKRQQLINTPPFTSNNNNNNGNNRNHNNNNNNNNKRSTTLITPSLEPKILTKKPLNVIQNGPYFINHYTIYCDRKTFEQIKNNGDLWNDFKKLNFDNFDFKQHPKDNDEIYSGDKEIDFLELPKDGDTGESFGGTLTHADYDFSANLPRFEISLDIKPPKVPDPITSDFLLPLDDDNDNNNKNHINYNQKHNNDLHQLIDYLNQNGGGDGKSGILELPHFEKHPLEHDSIKSTYNTPGAVDSYGHLATAPSTLSSRAKLNNNANKLDLRHVLPANKQSEYYELIDVHNSNNDNNNNKFTDDNYFSAELNSGNLQRRRRKRKDQKTKTNLEKSDKTLRHSNHRYE